MSPSGNEKPRRRPIGKAEWEVKKRLMGNKCVICGKSDKQVGGLEKAHIKAHSRGGQEVVPMCANHHKKYDKGELTTTQLKKIGLTRTAYKNLIPSKTKRGKEKFSWEKWALG